MPEVAVLIDATQILGGDPGVAAPELQFTRHAGRAGRTIGVLHLHPQAGHGLAQRPGFDREVRGARVVHQAHPDFRRAVHAADRASEGGLHEGGRFARYWSATPELRIIR
ncbi:hypothetical protein G6F65_023193 [Rhizopus arrhizus]|nr:hypothetical protein G6F65_023193 [Rhizopus arrhizus]